MDDGPVLNDMFTDGLVTVLQPPTLTLSHDRASVGTKIVVTGDGFPEAPFPQGFPRPVLVSFDNHLVGTSLPWQTVSSSPSTFPMLSQAYTVNVLDVVAFLRVNTASQ